MSLKKDIIKVGSSNFIVLLSSIINGLLLPSILTVIGFADLKIFSLYITFLGFFHFGFVDGLNIKYGGFRIENINFDEFEEYHKYFILQQSIISFIFICTGIFLHNEMVVFFGLAIIPINVQSFFLFFYQAIGEFKIYSRSTILAPITSIVLTLLFVLFKTKDYRIYVIIIIFSYFLSVLLLEFNYYKTQQSIKPFFTQLKNISLKWFIKSTSLNKKIFVSGFLIMIGNILFNFFFDIGRWMTKIFQSKEAFAIYSLSLSFIGIIIIFITALNKTFYPYLHRNQNSDLLLKLKNMLYVISSMFLPVFFILKEIITIFLPSYLDSLPVAAILITSIPAIFVIKSIYMNLYKVKKNERKFLLDTITYLLIGTIINAIFFYFIRNIVAIAIASVVTIYVWSLFPKNFLKFNLLSTLHEIAYIILIISSFFVVYNLNFSFLANFLISIILIFFINLIFHRSTLKSLSNLSL